MLVSLSFRAADPNDTEPLTVMIERAQSLTASQCLGFCRAASIALNLVNSAEVHHRLRCIKTHEIEQLEKVALPGPLYHTDDSVKGSIQAILDSKQATKEEIFNQIC